MNIYSPRIVKELLEKYELNLKKSLGQNFLIDRNIAENIADAVNLDSQTVVEIGPGIGALTIPLASRASCIIALEIDSRIIPLLEEVISELDNVLIVKGDALKYDFDFLVEKAAGEEALQKGYVIAANLPYYAAAPIIMHVVRQNFKVNNFIFMVQREVAERLAAKPGTKAYGSISVNVQFFAKPEIIARVPATVFFPKPDVDSAVVKLDIYSQPPVEVEDRSFFFKVVGAAFGKRRKKIVNALENLIPNLDRSTIETACQKAGIKPTVRGEKLSVTQFAALSDALIQLKQETRKVKSYEIQKP